MKANIPLLRKIIGKIIKFVKQMMMSLKVRDSKCQFHCMYFLFQGGAKALEKTRNGYCSRGAGIIRICARVDSCCIGEAETKGFSFLSLI